MLAGCIAQRDLISALRVSIQHLRLTHENPNPTCLSNNLTLAGLAERATCVEFVRPRREKCVFAP